MSALTGISLMSSLTGISGDSPSQAPIQPPEELPRASDDATYFMDSIAATDYKFLMFPDNLITTSDTGKELGDFNVTIESTKRDGAECFLIHANSHGAIDGVPCGTSIVAYVSKKLETLEQQHHEYVKLENHPLDRKTFITRQEEGYVINKVITQGEEVQRAAQTYKHDDMKGFISEGSNLLLQRLFVKKGVPDDCVFISLDSESNLCQTVYKPLEERKLVVTGEDLIVLGVERTINSFSDLPTTWQSYFTKDGHLSNRVQVGSPVTMRLNRVPTPVEDEEEPDKPTFDKQPLNWQEDTMMFSKFLDRKEELKSDHVAYMKEHPELKAILADFLQFLLLRKPKDAIAFSAEYFSSFSVSVTSSGPYMSSAAPTPYPMSRTNTKIEKSAGQVK